MNIIPEPYKSRIIEILKSSKGDNILHNLKMFLLKEEYFKKYDGDTAWLANQIYKQYLKNRRT